MRSDSSRSTSVAGDPVGADRDVVVGDPVDARAELGEQREHRLDVGDPRHVADDDLVVGQQRRGEDRQRAVLVAGGHDRCPTAACRLG